MLELTTPKVRTDHRLAAEFRPKKIEPWLERLPRADRETCVAQLQKALTAQNRVALAPAVRLQLMELYLGPFLEIYASHHSDLSTIARVPLHPHYRSKQEDMLELLEAFAAGYKIAVLDLAEQRRGQNRRPDLALALQRAVYCVGQVLITVFELYMRPPGGAWRDLHELYRCAEEEELCELEVRPLLDKKIPQDVQGSYLPVLLVGASAPLGLLPGEARRLHDLAPQWHSTLKLSGGSGVSSGPGYFLVNLKSDAAPVPMSKSSKPVEASVRVLRTLGVARAMHDALTTINDPATQKALRSVLIPGVDSADVELFRRAGRVLGEVNIKRASTRFDADQEVEFCSGYESVYFVCSEVLSFDPSGAIPEEDAGGDAEREEEQFIDLSEPMLGVPIVGGTEGGQASAIYRARAVNQSAAGMCLVLPPAREVRVKVGDIGACRFGGGADWQLGAVRWMRVGSREIRFGIQFLGPHAVPVTVVAADAGAASGNGGSPQAVFTAIWMPENAALKQPSSLVLPRSADLQATWLVVLDAPAGSTGVPARMRLLGRLDRTGDYEHFLVSVDPSGSES